MGEGFQDDFEVPSGIEDFSHEEPRDEFTKWQGNKYIFVRRKLEGNLLREDTITIRSLRKGPPSRFTATLSIEMADVRHGPMFVNLEYDLLGLDIDWEGVSIQEALRNAYQIFLSITKHIDFFETMLNN